MAQVDSARCQAGKKVDFMSADVSYGGQAMQARTVTGGDGETTSRKTQQFVVESLIVRRARCHARACNEVMTEGFLGGELFGISCDFGGGLSEHVAFQMPDATAAVQMKG
eukprot:Skav203778  [mRNA]  locus=scaffold206:296200:297306:+ [translate_table: standard]